MHPHRGKQKLPERRHLSRCCPSGPLSNWTVQSRILTSHRSVQFNEAVRLSAPARRPRGRWLLRLSPLREDEGSAPGGGPRRDGGWVFATPEGERVEKGQVLVKLDTAILDAELKQQQADLGLARDTFERNRSLSQRGVGTQVAFDEATAKLASAEARVQLSKAKLAQSTLVAPFNGVVGLRAVSVGDFVAVGKQLITLTNIDPIKVDFRVAEIFLSQVRVGQTISLKVDAVPNKDFQGQIFAVDPVVDINGRAIRLRATVPNRDLVLKPGLFARVTIVVDQRENAMLIPESAVVPDGIGKVVFIVENGKAKRVAVELGKRLPGKVEVLKGLTPQMQVVSSGQMRLRDGSNVSIKNAPPPVQTSALPVAPTSP
ncbi:MAG: hypothetical protein B7Z40_16430 [Bosea sp. 12-68-7]|nr:MAG: hypothetical protein B7Z40_16430 [Bosea sp. 12-68-7]